MRLTLLALVTLLSTTCAPLVAMPADYVGEANHLASAEELNLLYISIPHRPGVDKFNVLTSHRISDTEKYYLLELPRDGGKDFLIADTTNNGVKIYYKGPEAPFKDGNAPILDKPMPMRGLKGLFDNLNSVTLKVSSSLQPDDSQWVHDVICKKSGRLIGTVRSCWAHKYGSRYGSWDRDHWRLGSDWKGA